MTIDYKDCGCLLCLDVCTTGFIFVCFFLKLATFQQIELARLGVDLCKTELDFWI